MTRLAFLLLLLFAVPDGSGELLVTEFLPDPSGTDIDREWFEIYNSGNLAINLTGYAAGDGTNPTNLSTGEAMGVFPDNTMINAGEVFVIAANANGFNAFYGFLPAFEFANSTSALGNNPDVPDLPQKADWGAANGSLGIANGGDDVAILAPGSTALSFTFVDGGNHGSVATFYGGATTLGSNQSYERLPANQDTDSIDDWMVRTSGTATPGLITIPEPSSLGMLAISALGFWRRRPRDRFQNYAIVSP